MPTRELPLETMPRAGLSEAASERVFGGRYRALRLLKKGGDVETLLGTDLMQGDLVIIKAAAGDSFSAGARMRLEHEAAILRQVRSPYLAPILDCAEDEDHLYLVLPFLPGVTLQERLRSGPASVDESITIGRCLLLALREAHEHGILHRDVKPANVMVDDMAPVRRATLIDFGLARSTRLDASIRDQPVGTVRYMAPEQAGLLDHEVDEKSDLYAAGVVLFECLAGVPPFPGESVGEVLRQHLTVRPPELRSLGLSVPRALDEIIQRLLRKDPRDRYQSAEAVAADLETLQEARANGVVDPALVVGLQDRRRTLTQPAFVGRGGELSALDAQVEKVLSGRGGLVLLEAESGGGKTRLLSEVRQRALRQGVWVLRGEGLDQAAQRPFQVLVGVAGEMIAAARTDPDLASSIRQRLGDQQAAACAALPELAEVMGPARAEVLGPETFGQARSIQALSAFLDALGSRDRPVLVLLDDCQWADELTLKLLAQWPGRRGPEEELARHVLLVVAFRSEEVPEGHRLRTLAAEAHITLGPFQTQDVRRLAESMAGPLPEEAITAVERLAEGSPFMAGAVLRGLVESGALVAGPSGWQVEPLALADVQSSGHAAAFLARRIELLPEGAVRLLSVGAVLGKEFELDLAASLAGQPPSEAIAALDEARRRHIVWMQASGTRCVFIHDKLRQTFLDRLPEPQQKELHRLAAQHLERDDPGRVFELAYHFDAAGDGVRALPYALAAAGQARSQYALEIAEQQYRIAERGAQGVDQATRYRITEGLGDVLMLRGHYEEAARHFEEARRLAEGQLDQARMEGKLGELAFKVGDLEKAGAAIERALRLLGKGVPRRFTWFLPLLVWELLVQGMHTLLAKLFLGRRSLEKAEMELTAIRLYSRLGHVYWFRKGPIPTLWTHLRGMNHAERYPPTPELAQAYSEHAPAMTLIPYFSRGILYAQKSLAIRTSLGDLWGQGQSLHFYGLVLYAASRYRECIDRCREAVRLLERTGDRWEVNNARFQIAASLYRLGDLRAAEAEARKIHQDGLELGDTYASGMGLDIWSRASRGVLASRTIQVELDQPSADVQRKAHLMLAEGVRLLHETQPAEAAAVFERGHQLARKAGIKNVYVFPLLPWLATALRLEAERLTDRTPGRRLALLRRAETAARQGLRLARKFQNDLPHALRENALLASIQGRHRLARQLFDESLTVAERQGARYEHAQTLLARGEIGRELGWPDSAEDLEAARQALTSLEEPREEGDGKPERRPATLSLADRFDNVLEAGRAIASALSREGIFDAVREAALRLLRGERCVVLEVGHQGTTEELAAVSGEVEEHVSREMAWRAVKAGHALAFAEEAADQVSESAILAGSGSALCAPIFVRGQAAGCFYVKHRQVANLFGADEERLADFIATIAGAALENAEGFQELRRLNETLEQRVIERTRAVETRSMELASSYAELERTAAELRHSQEQLQLAKEAAERANRAKSEFLANMSHEIRTPMNGILGMTDLTLGTDLAPEQREYLNIVKSSADALLTVINDILDFSKIEAGKLDIEAIEFRLRDLVGDTLKTLALRAHEKDLELAWDIRPEVPDALVGDPGRLRQIIINLIGNAIKFTRQGEVVLQVALENGEQGDKETASSPPVATGGLLGRPPEERNPQPFSLSPCPRVCLSFSVRDTGMGIPREKQKAIFEPFEQVDSSTTRLHGGTGLGLAICVKLVKMMGGRLWVESEVGQGSTFRFTSWFDVPPCPAPAAKQGVPAGLSGLPVLVVDDSATNRQILGDLLAGWGMNPMPAEGGRSALVEIQRAAAEGEPYPLVLLDARMPDLDGFAVVQHLQPGVVGAVIMMLTSREKAQAVARCREVGLSIHLTKPVKPGELLEAMSMAIQRSQGQKPDKETRRQGDKETEERGTVPATGQLRILVAEDNPVNQKVATLVLRQQGHRVVVAENGKKALATLEAEPFDLVLMDVQMPEMDGFEATAAIRTREKETGRHIPIIAMTAHAMKGDRERCLASGMDGYVAKPIQARELYQVIGEIGRDTTERTHEKMETAPRVFDQETALADVGGSMELLQEIAEVFIADAPRLLGELHEAVQRRDCALLKRAGHSIKGSVANFSAPAAVEAAWKLESMGREGNLEGVEEAQRALELQIGRLLQALAGLLQRSACP